jgi:hypothetical protein
VLRHPHHRPGAGHLRIEIALLASLTNTGRFKNGCAMLNAASARSRLTNGARPQTVTEPVTPGRTCQQSAVWIETAGRTAGPSSEGTEMPCLGRGTRHAT